MGWRAIETHFWILVPKFECALIRGFIGDQFWTTHFHEAGIMSSHFWDALNINFFRKSSNFLTQYSIFTLKGWIKSVFFVFKIPSWLHYWQALVTTRKVGKLQTSVFLSLKKLRTYLILTILFQMLLWDNQQTSSGI